mmetsp:Transcript_12825/g.24074  ORF Transcript_12825/g.24074 Transcript_12825/m.24074 type:complete len:356 (-) Transcript_12825:69-1136(-)
MNHRTHFSMRRCFHNCRRVLQSSLNQSLTSPPPLSAFINPPKLVTKNFLEQSDLLKLFHHEITALHIKSFYPPSHAKTIAQELDQKAQEGQIDNWRIGTERGLEVSDVWTEGEYVPYNVAMATNQVEEYFRGVQKDFRKRRTVSVPSPPSSSLSHPDGTGDDSLIKYQQSRLWPLDLLRLELDEVWMDGAGLARSRGDDKRVQGGGLPRIMIGPTRWKKGFIHADQFSPLSKVQGLFSGNIYLQLPSDTDRCARVSSSSYGGDGDLQIWNLEIYSESDWIRYQNILKGLVTQDAELQMRLRKELGEPLKICVEAGDLVMLCVQKPHCAVGFINGKRISLQCFIRYEMNERLLIDI